MKNSRAIISWSGGKDACLALHEAYDLGYDICALFTMMNEEGRFSRSNGVNHSVLQAQAKALALPIYCYPCSWANYEHHIIKAVSTLVLKYDCQFCVFGDIDIMSHRKFEEHICSESQISALLPLWGYPREQIANMIMSKQIQSRISAIKTVGKKLLGKDYNQEILSELMKLEFDLCGENGEFHTLVYNAPLFSKPLSIERKACHSINDMSVCELLLSEHEL